ncbi:CASP-like protein 4B1 [Asparagus officinalis]|uniref:CASP-like protein 4B1 n=1 Tax=Asparagus officinalis TaxID=4686 RepID=UPI00098E777C|nr:CASP-like protein 4B1 [Asparagus officinalis]
MESSNPPPTDARPVTQAPDTENNPPNTAEGSVLRRWKRENLLEKCTLSLRGLCWLFSLVSFVVMAANNQGDGQNFDQYQEYQLCLIYFLLALGTDLELVIICCRYCLAIAILAFVYTMVQVAYQVYRLSTDNYLIPNRAMGILDFVGDQVTAYLLISALSAAIPITDSKRDIIDTPFTDSASASISMAFFAFLSIALSALISGYKLSTQTYI